MEPTLVNFAQAIDSVFKGNSIAYRKSWVNTKAFIFARPSDTLPKDFIPKVKSLPKIVKEHLGELDQDIFFTSYLCKFREDSSILNGWQGTTEDVAAEDWIVQEYEENLTVC